MRLTVLAMVGMLGACAHSPVDDPQDPLEPVNRRVYAFNEKVDKYVAKPVARGYVAAVPNEIRIGVHNFLANLGYPTVIVNDVLQAKLHRAGHDTGRFLLNTSFGLVGFLDPATLVGLDATREDLGQTLGHWGLGQGWYLMLPFLGPSTNRDLVGRVGDTYTAPIGYTDYELRFAVTGVQLVDMRSQLLGSEGILQQQFDPYIFVRSAYLQRRQNQVYDGNPPKEEVDWGE